MTQLLSSLFVAARPDSVPATPSRTELTYTSWDGVCDGLLRAEKRQVCARCAQPAEAFNANAVGGPLFCAQTPRTYSAGAARRALFWVQGIS